MQRQRHGRQIGGAPTQDAGCASVTGMLERSVDTSTQSLDCCAEEFHSEARGNQQSHGGGQNIF